MAKEVVNYTTKLKDSGNHRTFDSGAVRDMGIGKGRCDLLPLKEVNHLVYLMESVCPDNFSDIRPVLSAMYDAALSFKIVNDNYSMNGDPDTIGNELVICQTFLYHALISFILNEYIIDDINRPYILEPFKNFYSRLSEKDNSYNALFRLCKNDFLYSAILDLSKHFEAGARKYEERNWEKGIPIKCYIDSALRHYFKFKRGDADEPHDIAFMWNVICCIWTIEHVDPEIALG